MSGESCLEISKTRLQHTEQLGLGLFILLGRLEFVLQLAEKILALIKGFCQAVEFTLHQAQHLGTGLRGFDQLQALPQPLENLPQHELVRAVGKELAQAHEAVGLHAAVTIGLWRIRPATEFRIGVRLLQGIKKRPSRWRGCVDVRVEDDQQASRRQTRQPVGAQARLHGFGQRTVDHQQINIGLVRGVAPVVGRARLNRGEVRVMRFMLPRKVWRQQGVRVRRRNADTRSPLIQLVHRLAEPHEGHTVAQPQLHGAGRLASLHQPEQIRQMPERGRILHMPRQPESSPRAQGDIDPLLGCKVRLGRYLNGVLCGRVKAPISLTVIDDTGGHERGSFNGRGWTGEARTGSCNWWCRAYVGVRFTQRPSPFRGSG